MATRRESADPAPLSPAERQALEGRNLRDFAWLALEGIRVELGYAGGAAPIVSLIRALHAMGESSMDLEEASEVAVVNGFMVHGLPPRTEREWEIASRIFEPSVVERMRTWDPLTGFLAG